MLASRRNRLNEFLGKSSYNPLVQSLNEPSAKVDTGQMKEEQEQPLIVDTTNKKKKRNQNDYVRFSIRNRKKEIEI